MFPCYSYIFLYSKNDEAFVKKEKMTFMNGRCKCSKNKIALNFFQKMFHSTAFEISTPFYLPNAYIYVLK